jgi:hypothetical protein
LCPPRSIDIFAAVVAYPLDTIRRNMMMMSGRAANEVTFTTSYGCFKHIMSNGGVKVLYKGVFANSVRAVGRYYHSALVATLAAYTLLTSPALVAAPWSW